MPAAFIARGSGGGPARIVSMNAAPIKLLIPLADPQHDPRSQPVSRDAWQSFAAADARHYTILSAARGVLVMRPDVRRRESVRQALDARVLEREGFTSPNSAAAEP